MTDEELDGIRERSAAATPGPWEWRHQQFRSKYLRERKDGTWVARPGMSANESWVMLLTGAPLWRISVGVEDEWDYHRVIGLRWGQIKGTSINLGPSSADADFIAHSRQDVLDLLGEVERLRMRIAEIEGEV